MLSILIPTYNYPVAKLVAELHEQAVRANIEFEIIVIEDGSTEIFPENKELENLPNVRYSVLTQNIGRAAIRNKLADTAQYDNLLFIDCDAAVDNEKYIENYLPHLGKNEVAVGGVKYVQRVPRVNVSLRLKYGINREQKIDHFTTFNFLIPKKTFEKIRFNETINGYGYEDTLFGNELNVQQIPIKYIQNKLIHTGLDGNIIFLKKAEQGIKNLYALYISGKYPFLCKTSKILKTFTRIKRLHLITVFCAFERALHNIIYKNLLGKNPSLFLFDIYKLSMFCKIAKK
ncbi:MAG: glycosyltransferase [Bacteroidales bacterium]|jgi:glycosyltransferase involved in cell wall biosynthesis|nr:glycosyltransferase [Bacteroidales bacterium]